MTTFITEKEQQQQQQVGIDEPDIPSDMIPPGYLRRRDSFLNKMKQLRQQYQDQHRNQDQDLQESIVDRLHGESTNPEQDGKKRENQKTESTRRNPKKQNYGTMKEKQEK